MTPIRIISTPPGFADEEIRKQWVGLSLPVLSEEEVLAAKHKFNSKDDNAGGYIVRGPTAVMALDVAGRHAAATFWSTPYIPEYLRFIRSCCEIDLLPDEIRAHGVSNDLLRQKAVQFGVTPGEMLMMSLATIAGSDLDLDAS